MRSAWMYVTGALVLLVMLAWWSHKLSGSSLQTDRGGSLPFRSSLVQDGDVNPAEPVDLPYPNEDCVPWAISKAYIDPPAQDLTFLVIGSKMSDPDGLVLSGFSEECGRKLEILVHEDIRDGRIQQVVRDLKPDSIIAVGKGALERASREAPNTPILFAKIPDPHSLVPHRALVAGISDWVPAKPVMRHLLKLLPADKQLAFLYPKGVFDGFVGQARRAAVASGARIVDVQIEDKRGVDTLLIKVSSPNWGWVVFPDRKIIDREVFSQILVAAEKNKVRVGVSDEEHVRRGALVGVGTDTHRIGRQLCRLAASFIRHGLPSAGRVFCPEYSFAVINNSVVEKLGMTLDLEHVRQAKLYKWH